MKKPIFRLFSPLFLTFLLFSCAQDEEYVERYTIIWQDDEGNILEIDRNVAKNAVPTYDGEDPIKEGCIFDGWVEEIEPATKNAQYTAKFIVDISTGDLPSNKPTFVSETEILYGYYPQSRVSGSVCSILDGLEASPYNGWILYDGDFYASAVASTYINESYKFDDGESIVNGDKYWFKCEPIEWSVLETKDSKNFVVSKKCLDVSEFNDSLVSNIKSVNDYSTSTLRNKLVNNIYKKAFVLGDSYSDSSSFDKDRIGLLSKNDVCSSAYGFDLESVDQSSTRTASTTDYFRAIGGFINNKDKDFINNSTYWLNTNSVNFDYASYVVNSGGVLSEYAVTSEFAVRPAMYIINK